MPRSFYTLLADIVTLAPAGCAGPAMWFAEESLVHRHGEKKAEASASDEIEPETALADAKTNQSNAAASNDTPATAAVPAKLAADQQVADRAAVVAPPPDEPRTDPAIEAQVQALGFDDPAEELAALAAIQAAPAAHRAFLLRTMQASLLARQRAENRRDEEPPKLSTASAPEQRLERRMAQEAVVAIEVQPIDDSQQDEPPAHTPPAKPDSKWRGQKKVAPPNAPEQKQHETAAVEVRDEQDWQAYVDEAALALEEQLRSATDKPDPLEQARLRLLYLVTGRRDDAVAALDAGSPAEKEFWSKELYALGTLFDESQSDRTRRAALASEHLREAADRLGELGGLVVKNAHFCTEVKGFGTFTAFPKDEFRLGQEVLLYCEVENFHSKPTDRGHHTALKGRYQILDAAGNVVAEKDLSLKEEHCQNKRRDFFIPYFLWMPKQILPGTYQLKLTIEDVHAQQMAETSIEFAIKEK
jgi:hypothetical protein